MAMDDAGNLDALLEAANGACYALQGAMRAAGAIPMAPPLLR